MVNIPLIIGFSTIQGDAGFRPSTVCKQLSIGHTKDAKWHPNHLSRIGMDYADTDAKLAVGDLKATPFG